jgi:fibronectin type 3 domain-containing protein
VSTGSSTAYTVTGLQSGQTYYFAVTAVDASGRESPFSNEASKLIP